MSEPPQSDPTAEQSAPAEESGSSEDSGPGSTTSTSARLRAAEATDLLAQVVGAMGGTHRQGQHEMVVAVAESLTDKQHALIQAGTGTGKSLGYLIPAIVSVQHGADPVVVATATLALQHQLVNRDLPLLAEQLRTSGCHEFSYAVLKGRANYLCKQKLDRGSESQLDLSMEPGWQQGRLEAQAAEVQKWAQATVTGDRDELDNIDAKVWRSFSVTAKECVGASKCSFGEVCWAELARAKAATSDIIVTNHALLALHALESIALLPEHSAVIVDEGHELADRATGALTVELSPAALTRVAGSARSMISSEGYEALIDAAPALADALFDLNDRIVSMDDRLRSALAHIRDVTHNAATEIAKPAEDDAHEVADRHRVKTALLELHDNAGAILNSSADVVVWVARIGNTPQLYVAPLSVAERLRAALFDQTPTIVTSATLALGGSFSHTARELGLGPIEAGGWRAVDVASPFDYAKQGIIYLAADLPRPTTAGVNKQVLQRMRTLIDAAGGRSLALFSSWRGVEAGAEVLADVTDYRVIVAHKGDAIGSLVRQFSEDETSVLVGTLSLWQGVDVPGAACIQVLIDRIPFPRPTEPIIAAKSERAEAAGRSGFQTVSVPRAALLLAQGSGRLIRSAEDRGVVSILDSRLVNSNYGKYLLASMPDLWPTTREDQAVGALLRLAASLDATADCAKSDS